VRAKIDFFAFDDCFRRAPGRGVHHKSLFQGFGLEPFYSPVLRGMQVLRDCFHLSYSQTLIGSFSNLSQYASLLNPELKRINLNL